MTDMPKYPIGQQDFKMLRENNCVYVDKTMYIHKLVKSGGQYFFLARPRRFGKSLFLSTLQYFFEGRRDLFKGLYIESTDWQWQAYPVLHLDLNTDRYQDPGMLDSVLDNALRQWEERYDVSVKDSTPSQRFKTVIRAAHEKTGLPVIILVDEYDKPLVGNLNTPVMFDHYRTRLASLYSNFKSSAEHIGLVFLTGVSRLSKLSVFSDLNNLKDISFTDEYADICGITDRELTSYFEPGLKKLADKQGLSYDDTIAAMKKNYDGYRFSADGSDIYNPWSVLNCLDDSEIDDYWNETGMPTVIAESLKRVNSNLEKTFDTICPVRDLKGLDLMNPDPVALLYQTGYLTIKEYYPGMRKVRLGIPNTEVRTGLLTVLLPYYVRVRRGTTTQLLSDLQLSFELGHPEDAMKAVQAYFAGVDYKLQMDNENNFHNAFFLMMDFLGLNVKAEAHTSDGSIDILIMTDRFVYIIELKYDRSAREALRQIEDKRYALQFGEGTRKVFEIGVNFSSKTRTIENWIVKA